MKTFTVLGLAAVASARITSIFNITATPDQVISNAGVRTPGQPGAVGQFNYAIDSENEIIYYDITLTGVSGTYQSPARTATHIHQGDVGKAGPPRIAFPNPVGDDSVRRSVGYLTGPFTTGIKGADNVTDTGAGFSLKQIEANPANFFTDSHTNLFVAGVVRGQLNQSFKLIPKEDGSAITTATLTKTEEVTITKCPETKTLCPVVVTKTEKVYTTICPVSELPHYTKPVETKPVETKPVVTKPAETHPTPVYPTKSSGPITSLPVGTATGAPTVTTSRPAFTGAATANKVGGLVMLAGLAAALL